MFERHAQHLMPRAMFMRRQLRHLWLAGGLIFIALAIGAVGYHWIESLGWVDSFYSASMILTGMGPAFEVRTTAGKLFATVYALFSGIVFLSAASVLIAPMLHRMLHAMHLDSGRGAGREE